uniref:Vesicle transport protein n=1 Tax=Hyaloperonospora arabidopsidis (strain Emoy2) TaxID=559515 RepID=M4BXC0_HYAAE
MLEQVKAKSTQATTLVRHTAESLHDVAQQSSLASSFRTARQKGTAALQAKVGVLHTKLPPLGKLSTASSAAKSTTTSESGSSVDLEEEGDGDRGGEDTCKAITSSQEKEGLLLGDLGHECGLTKRQRLYGALGCYGFGTLCGLLSTLMMWGGPKHMKQFAFFYTLGAVCSIGSSLFLVGPMRQLRVMCMPVRRLACCVWMSSMVATLVIAFGFPKAGPLVLLLVLVQYAAMLWYGASFVPYGRAILRSGCSKAAKYVST